MYLKECSFSYPSKDACTRYNVSYNLLVPFKLIKYLIFKKMPIVP